MRFWDLESGSEAGAQESAFNKPLTPTVAGEQLREVNTGHSQTLKGKTLTMCKEIFLYLLKRSLHHASGSYWYARPLLHQELRLGCLPQVALAEPGMKHMGSREIHPEALPPAAPLSCPRPAAGEEGYRCPHSLWKEAPSSLVLILPAGSAQRQRGLGRSCVITNSMFIPMGSYFYLSF